MEGERYAPSTFLGRQARPLPAGPLAPARWRSRRWVLVPARRDRPRTHDLWKTTHPVRAARRSRHADPDEETRGPGRGEQARGRAPRMGDAREETRATRGGVARMTPARRRPRKMRATRGGVARGHPHDGSARRCGRGRESGQRQERQVLLVAGGPAGADAAEKTGRPAGADGPEAREREREGPEPLGLSRLRACARRARGGTRTPMIVRSHGPEPCASTNSATRARSEADDSRSGPPASNQSDPQTGETRHPPDPSAPPPHPPGHTGYDGPDGSVPAEEPVILGGEEHGVPGQVREGR